MKGAGQIRLNYSKSFSLVFIVLAAVVIFGLLTLQRDRGYGGPSHDEVIALLAAKALERDYNSKYEGGLPPFHDIAPAAEWHRYTKDFEPRDFAEIRQDVLSLDKHPPLSFWVMSRWLARFQEGTYGQAVILVWLQVLVAGCILAICIYRLVSSESAAVLGLVLFLAGNAAVFTASWVRQYALLVALFGAVVALSAELARRNLSIGRFVALSLCLGLVCLLGMLTQYTFITMTAPIHVALVTVLAARRSWKQIGLLGGAYVAAGAVFFTLMPGVMDQVAAASGSLERRHQWGAALVGMPQMFVPMPSDLPAWLHISLGAAAFAIPFVLAALVLLRKNKGMAQPDRAMIAVPLAGMLGAGLLQLLLVGLGYFPTWATGPNHLAAFWLLTVFAASLAWNRIIRMRGVLTAAVIVVLLGMQGLYVWHMHQILPKLNKSYIASRQPDLLLLDNMARGHVLQITDVTPAAVPILVTDSNRVAARFAAGELNEYVRILYLPIEETVEQGKPQIVAAAIVAGWQVEELPVIHVGTYEAILIESRSTD